MANLSDSIVVQKAFFFVLQLWIGAEKMVYCCAW